MYYRVGKTGSLGLCSRVIVYCCKLYFCLNDFSIGGSFCSKAPKILSCQPQCTTGRPFYWHRLARPDHTIGTKNAYFFSKQMSVVQYTQRASREERGESSSIKGQLISKCLFVIFNSPKKRTKNSSLLVWYIESNCFCLFFGSFEDIKKAFRN